MIYAKENAGLPFRFSQERKVSDFQSLDFQSFTYQSSPKNHLSSFEPLFFQQICDEWLHQQLGIKFHIQWTPFWC
jgi:hypothetical protein